MKNNERKININIEDDELSSPELEWEDDVRSEIERRIINLKFDQIASLLQIVGLGFKREDIKEIVEDIKQEESNSIHLDILMTEADTKEKLLWWIRFFENYNK